jgi:hypothetical protein
MASQLDDLLGEIYRAQFHINFYYGRSGGLQDVPTLDPSFGRGRLSDRVVDCSKTAANMEETNKPLCR